MQKLLLFPILFLLCFSVEAQPVVRMSNTTLRTCEMFIVDSDSLQGNYASGVLTMTIISANDTRLAFNMEDFLERSGNDVMEIFDGPTTSSPLITSIRNVLFPEPWFAVSTGSTLTFRFTAGAPNRTGRFRGKIRCVANPAPLSLFYPVVNLPVSGNIQVADYDKDNDKDLLVGGQIYRNDSYFDSLYLMERKSDVLTGWSNPRFVAGDFDNDGDMDVFITGLSVIPGFSLARAALYTNDGTGVFTRLTSQVFDPAYNGACSVVDFNNDGRLDICYTGRSGTTSTSALIFKIYINNGNLSFSDAGITMPGLNGLMGASMSWADSDGDGDKDLVINGYSGENTFSRLFINNGSSLVLQSVPLTNVSGGRIVWADVDGNGKPDIVNSGVRTPSNINAIVPEILFNNGNNSFMRVSTNLPALPLGNHDWGNYDNDTDLDVVLNGMKPDLSSDVALYKNNGNGSFTRIELPGGAGFSTIKWLDINQDGKLDVFVTGKADNFSYFLKNMGSDIFKKSSFPLACYNTSGTTLLEDFTGDGRVDVLLIGELSDVDCYSNYSSILVKSIGWQFSPIPSFTKVVDLQNSNPYATTTLGYSPYWKWGDFDSDGLLDILLTTDSYSETAGGPYILIFKNLGNNNFQLAYDGHLTPLPSPSNGRQVGIFDIDNDGKNELFVTFNSVYKWVNNSWVSLYSNTPTPCNIGCIKHYVDFADYDKDGYMDAAVNYLGYTHIFRNNGAGRLVRERDFAGSDRQIKWYDMDNDGDLDLLSGKVILENRNGELVAISNGIKNYVHTAVGDFNGDGFPDLINMTRNTDPGIEGDFYLNMQGSMFFKNEITAGMLDCVFLPWNESVESFDMDGDGDDDIIHTGNVCCNGSVIFSNFQNLNHKNLRVIKPNITEVIPAGTTQTIQWYGALIGPTVKIELSRDSLQSWELIATAASTPTGGSFQWNATGPSSSRCFIRISDNSDASLQDVSDVVFSILTTVPVDNPITAAPVEIFPNPTSERLFIRNNGNIPINGVAGIFNIQGTEVGKKNIKVAPGQTTEMDIKSLNAGVYFLRIYSNNKSWIVKFIKQ